MKVSIVADSQTPVDDVKKGWAKTALNFDLLHSFEALRMIWKIISGNNFFPSLFIVYFNEKLLRAVAFESWNGLSKKQE